ncbi:ABC-type glycerol-3-phosphate transport system substrate-binding protein [Pullulanibacillus pueri]|nr:ABC-type glycerol-3-phosphate transport system substrate-binding protein [Pullulanibacillus pueri]
MTVLVGCSISSSGSSKGKSGAITVTFWYSATGKDEDGIKNVINHENIQVKGTYVATDETNDDKLLQLLQVVTRLILLF